jgi:alpha-tubulin suppressor-like RCC1 family protein
MLRFSPRLALFAALYLPPLFAGCGDDSAAFDAGRSLPDGALADGGLDAGRFDAAADGASDAGPEPLLPDGGVVADDPSTLCVGHSHACVIRDGGSVGCWGTQNYSGQLGDGTMNPSPTPVTVVGLTDAVEIGCGLEHTCARRAGGTVVCWGLGMSGQIGDGNTMNALAPRAVTGISDAVELSVGNAFSCVRHRSEGIACWGFGGPALGDREEEAVPRLVPVEVMGAPEAIAISAGHYQLCALRPTGTVSCWGDNGYGQLGTGAGTPDLSVPGADVVGLDDVRVVVAALEHTCALRASGGGRCWGRNTFGQLGDRTRIDRPAPVAVIGLAAIALARGMEATCALRADGRVVCWGRNSLGQLGDGTTTDSLMPVTAVGVSDAVEIAGAHDNICARIADGSVFCWGATPHPSGGLLPGPTPTRVPGL